MDKNIVNRSGGNILVYSRGDLLALRKTGLAGSRHVIPGELRRMYRGCRAGAKVKTGLTNNKRRRYKPPIPSVLMGNVNALTSNKMDELRGLIKTQRIYRESSLIILTESWLSSSKPDSFAELSGFSLVRADRDNNACRKKKGGGLILYVNDRWCNPGHVTVKEIICSRDIELLAVSLRPYYVPREISHVIAVCVYIQPRADAEVACETLYSTVARLQTQHPDSFIAISGDLNHVTLDSTLTGFHQFVDCPTRKNRTIDLLYANIKGAYMAATPLAQLGKSDHNMVYLHPQYVPLVQRQPVTKRSFRKWSPGAEDSLRDCFESTDWSTLQDPHSEDIEGLTDCLTGYMNFCLDVVVPVRTVRCYANNKPWVTSEVKAVLNRKKRAFKNRDQEEMKQAQQELRLCLREAKDTYRRKVEKKLRENNMREVWKGMKTITGLKQGNGGSVEGGRERANEFNTFYNRFDIRSVPPPAPHQPHNPTPPSMPPTVHTPPPAQPPSPPAPSGHGLPSPPPHPRLITADQVRGELRKIRPGKAAGPDKVCPRLLKACATELGAPLEHIFNLSLRLGRVPTLWKTSCIVPVPKKPRPGELNDFRPVALTSHLMKTLERLVLHLIRPQVQHAQDPLQFAYREKVGVEDAILFLLHRASTFLDKGGGAVRILFFDFSSAFNTIQPHLLHEKLTTMHVDPVLTTWITDYLTKRLQYVRLKDCTSDITTCSTGVPQGTVLAPLLFTLYTAGFRHSTEMCHLQKFSDDTAIVGCIRKGEEGEYRRVIQDFVDMSQRDQLQLNVDKTKELVIDFGRSRSTPQPVSIGGVEVEIVKTYKYLGVQLDHKLDWSANTTALYKKGQSRMFFLGRLASFNICRKLLQMFYQTVVSSVLFYAVVCWGGNARQRDTAKLDRLIKRASKTVGVQLDTVGSMSDRRTLAKALSILENAGHPLYSALDGQRSNFSSRLLSQLSSTDRLKDSFIPRAIRLYNDELGGR